MPIMTVEMDENEVKQAIIEWAEKHHGMKASNVNYSARMEYRGHGMSENEVPVPYVEFNVGDTK